MSASERDIRDILTALAIPSTMQHDATAQVEEDEALDVPLTNEQDRVQFLAVGANIVAFLLSLQRMQEHRGLKRSLSALAAEMQSFKTFTTNAERKQAFFSADAIGTLLSNSGFAEEEASDLAYMDQAPLWAGIYDLFLDMRCAPQNPGETQVCMRMHVYICVRM